MQTELVPHVGINLATKEKQAFRQSFIIFKGVRVGLVGWKESDKVIFTTVMNDFEKEVVVAQVAKILKQERDYVDCPELTQDEVESSTESEYDEFIESDFI